MVDDVKYLYKTVQAVRGTEARSITKWQNQGWELVDQTPGRLRTTLNFRRPQPKPPWLLIGAVGGVALVLLAIFGIVAAVQAVTGDDSPAPAAAASETPTETPTETPSEAPTETATEEPSETATPTEDPTQVLTAKNNKDFAAALAVDEGCNRSLKTFAAEYADRTIEFDGSIAAMAYHGDYDTRYDILMLPGDKGPMSVDGPSFKYEDVGMAELNLTGKVPNRIGAGTKLHIVADVAEYNANNCLFFLTPVSTKVR